MRIGHGYDVHKFAENRKLIIGGEEIPFELGLLGHSDADVLITAWKSRIWNRRALRYCFVFGNIYNCKETYSHSLKGVL